MSETLDLSPIERRLQQITDPNWEWTEADMEGEDYVYVPETSTLGSTLIMMESTYENHAEDATFIAHAPKDVAALLAEVTRLRQTVDELSNKLVDVEMLVPNIDEILAEYDDERPF
jgi:hypothetical protein